MSLVRPSRRRLLQLAGATTLAPGLIGLRAKDQTKTIGRVLAVSDMHSAYERTAQLLAAFEREVRTHPIPHVIAVNGDLFEHGNAVAVRSGGVIDWAFVEALPRLAVAEIPGGAAPGPKREGPIDAIGNIITTGVNFDLYQFKNLSLGAGIQYEKRTGQGEFDGNYILFHIAISRKF